MSWLDVLQRIELGEDALTEFKRGLGDFSAVGKALCAFANGEGGLLVLGVNDLGSIVGVKGNPEQIQECLTDFLHTGCGRPLTATCSRHRTKDSWVHWIDVPRQPRGFEPFSYDGRFWIRRGRSTVAPSSSELQELFNTFGLVLTEQQVIPSATANDIDLNTFHSFMRAQGKHTEDEPQPNLANDLNNAWVCAPLDGKLRPTLYGLMVFGRNPQGHPHTKSMFIQCGAYSGTDRASEVLSSGEATGRLDEQVAQSIGWFKSLGRKESYRGRWRTDIPLVPEQVLREALVNAVIHRDYAVLGSNVQLEVFADRIDVTSPGTLPNHMTVEQARSGGAPRSRNEMMANAMVVKQLMERRGRGWLLMRHLMQKFNGSEPELFNYRDGRFVRVTFRFESAQTGIAG